MSLIAAAALIALTAGCAGINGEAAGNQHGASGRSDIFRIPLP